MLLQRCFERIQSLDLVGEHVWMAGYGQPGTWAGGLLTGDGQERVGENSVDYLGWSEYGVGDNYLVADFAPRWLTTELPFEVMGTSGDSGGMWINDSGEVVAISNFNRVGFTGGIRVSQYSDWINNTTSSVPEPSTLVIFATGSLALLPRLLRRRKFRVRRNPLGKRCALFAFILCVPGLTTPAKAGMFATEEALQGADERAQDPMFAANGWIGELNFNGDVFHWGSAVLVAPNWILFAPHGRSQDLSLGLKFGLGSNVFTDPGVTRTITAEYWYPGYTGGWGGSLNDIALAYFPDPILDVAPVIRRTDPTLDLVGEHVVMAGYGQPGTYAGGLLPGDGQERSWGEHSKAIRLEALVGLAIITHFGILVRSTDHLRCPLSIKVLMGVAAV